VLDNYSPLRNLKKETLDKPAHLYPIEDALLYVPSAPLGLTGTGSQGADLWSAPNPAFGAVFSLYVKDVPKTLKEQRKEKESALEKEKKDVFYPTLEELKQEQLEEKAQFIWIIRDSTGTEIRKLTSSPSKGISRMNWNLRLETTSPINPNKHAPGRYESADEGALVTAGTYSVEIVLVKDGKSELLVPKTTFKVKALNNQTLAATNKAELMQFRKQVAELGRSINGSAKLMQETSEKLNLMKIAITNYPNADIKLLEEVRAIKLGLNDCSTLLYGDGLKASREFETLPSIAGRLGNVEYQLYESTTGVTKTQKDNIAISAEEYVSYRKQLDALIIRVKTLETKLEAVPIPYTKGNDENWKED